MAQGEMVLLRGVSIIDIYKLLSEELLFMGAIVLLFPRVDSKKEKLLQLLEKGLC